MMDRHVLGHALVDPELFQQRVKADARHDPAEADAERPAVVMDAHGDHRLVEARVGHAGHGQTELADEIFGFFHRLPTYRRGHRRLLKRRRTLAPKRKERTVRIQFGDTLPTKPFTKAHTNGHT